MGEGGWGQSEPSIAEACKLASWYNSHRQTLFPPPHPPERIFSLRSFSLWHNFPPEKVSLRMRGPRGGGAVGGVTLSHGSQAAPGTSGALLGASIPLRRKKK